MDFIAKIVALSGPLWQGFTVLLSIPGCWNLTFPVYVQVRVKSYVDSLSYYTKVSNAAESSNRKGINAILSCAWRMSLFKAVSVL